MTGRSGWPGDCAQLQALDVERRRHSPGDGGGGRTLAEERVNGPDTWHFQVDGVYFEAASISSVKILTFKENAKGTAQQETSS